MKIFRSSANKILMMLGFVLITVFVVLNFTGDSEPQAVLPSKVELNAREVIAVELSQFRQTLTVSGSLRALEQVVVKSKVAAEVLEVLVREGDSVKTGDILAKMDTKDLAAELAQSQSNLRAQASELALSYQTLERDKKLLDQGFIAQSDFDKRENDVRVKAANVRALHAQVTVAERALKNATVRAPIAGIIAKRSIEPGANTTVNAELFNLINLETMEFKANVPVSDINKISTQQKVLLNVEGIAKNDSEGVVARINPGATSNTHTVPVYISVTNKNAQLKEGMFVTADIVILEHNDVLLLPFAAIHQLASEPFVYKIVDDQLVKQPITLGLRDDDQDIAEISAGLNPGDRVVRVKYSALAEGVSVELME